MLPWKELFLSKVTILPSPKALCGMAAPFSRQSHPQAPSLGLLGEDFANAQLGCVLCSHSLHQSCQGLEHCTPPLPSSFL